MDINKFVNQIQNVQQQLKNAQQDLKQKEYIGKSGGNLVEIVMNGECKVARINIDPSLITKEDKVILQDLLIAAFNEARSKFDNESQNIVKTSLGNLDLPSNFKL